MKIDLSNSSHSRQRPDARLSAEAARATAIEALGFLAGDEDRIGRFMALTGVDPGHLRALSKEDGFLLAVLDFLAQDEKMLMEFAGAQNIPPERIGLARLALGAHTGGDGL